MENKFEIDKRSVELENLRIRENELSTEEGLRSQALNLGYQVQGDDVYVFTNSEDYSKSNDIGVITSDSEKKPFKYWTSSFTLLISFASSFIITIIIGLFKRSKVDEDDSEQEKSRDYRDNFNID